MLLQRPIQSMDQLIILCKRRQYVPQKVLFYFILLYVVFCCCLLYLFLFLKAMCLFACFLYIQASNVTSFYFEAKQKQEKKQQRIWR